MCMKSFQARPISYRVSAILAVVFGLLLVVGVATPYWHQSADGNKYGGLWSRCDADTGECTDLQSDVTEGWWVAVQVLEPLSLLCVTVACSAILFENCFSDVNAPHFMLELLGLLGGLLGLIGCIVFVAKTQPSSDDIYTTYSWSFYFALLGCAIVFIASVVILIGGKSAQKTLRLHRPEGQVSPEPVRRFSQLWARESPASPPGARKAALSREAVASFPPPTNLQPICEPDVPMMTVTSEVKDMN